MPIASAHAVAAVSGHFDTRTAATEVAGDLYDNLMGECDLVVLFASYHHRAAMVEAVETVRSTVSSGATIGVTAESVLGGDRELEGLAGMSALALRLPGMQVRGWAMGGGDDKVELGEGAAVQERLGLTPDARAVIMLADPFTTPTNALLSAIAGAAGAEAALPVIGGMASGASQPGHNVLVFDEYSSAAGCVGVTISGEVEVDCIVSQGARPIGEPLVVTKAKQNVILELGGNRAIDTLQELARALPDEEKQLLSKGVLLGVVISEYKDRFGRGDFLVSNIAGFDQRVGGIAVMGSVPVGRTVQFHVRDAATADEDLQLLLDAQQLAEAPLAALLFTCNGRGTRLFPEPHHDIRALRSRVGEVPVAGFFAAGEIGPIGARSFVHGHTASMVLFRAATSS